MSFEQGGVDALVQKSIKQGTDFLENSGDSFEFILHGGGWNLAEASSPAAKALEIAMDNNIGHSGHSFGFALKAVVAEAQKKFGYSLEIKDDDKGDKIVTLSK